MPEYGPETRERILERLAEGEAMPVVCRDPEMPAMRTVYNWMDEDDGFAAKVTRAREVGYQARATRALEEIATARSEDAAIARLKFDAERWYLGKLSNAFSDNKTQKHEVKTIGEDVAAWLGQKD